MLVANLRASSSTTCRELSRPAKADQRSHGVLYVGGGGVEVDSWIRADDRL